jgi:MGT family glycosyltransferase
VKKTHIAFFGIPHPAHANGTFPIVSALVRRGHRVSYVTSGVFAPRIRSLGAEAVVCKRWGAPEAERQPFFADHPRITVPNWDMICGINARILREVESLYENDRPDLIIYDLVAFAGRILANRWNIPAAQISPHFAVDKDGVASQIGNNDFREYLMERGVKATQFFERYGIFSENWLFHREDLNIYSIPKVFQPNGTAISDDRCYFAGRCVAQRSFDGAWQRTHDEKRPIALVTGSTTYVRDPEYFKMCLAALSGLHWHVVLAVGDRNGPTSLPTLPAHAEVVGNVSNLEILPHASLLICQGGNMSTTEAGYYGVPVIAATFGFAELEWCADNSIVRLGLGMHLKNADLDENHIRHAAIQIAEDSLIHRNVERVSHHIKCEPGAEDVAIRIGDYLKTRS